MLKKQRILLVEDEGDLVEVVTVRLEGAGYEVLAAMDGERGLEKARTEGPDLILLDLMLPKIDGFKVCKILKEDDQLRQIPILIFTARKRKDEEEHLLACGADGILYKPYRPEELFGKIQSLLSGRR
jgi:DNA-binding response OmpR family regulator